MGYPYITQSVQALSYNHPVTEVMWSSACKNQSMFILIHFNIKKNIINDKK